MLDEILDSPPKDYHQDLPITPILDMMVAIIFFLLLSTTFYSLTFQSVPPAQSVTITDPLEPPPRAPRLLIISSTTGIRASLNWLGAEPGVWKVQTEMSNPVEVNQQYIAQVKNLIFQFISKYPDEKTFQIGFGGDINYQIMVSTIEAVTHYVPDIALLSYSETEAMSRAFHKN